MSVLIKGMKMPRNCGECRLRWRSVITDMDTCKVLLKDIWKADLLTERLEDCPLVEVPAPHGRLIDEKQIPYIDLNADMPQSKVRVWTTFKDKIDRVPTIIEAEEGEKHETD